VGAAVVQNIGAYGIEMQSVVHEVVYTDLQTGLEHRLDHAGCRFGYRDSVFKSDMLADQYPYITSVTIRLHRYTASTYMPIITYGGIQSALTRLYPEIDIYTPTQVMETIITIRQSKLPDWRQIGTAGSFFVNPVVSDDIYSDLVAQFSDLI
jgi:UDP-N-acetylmuramate dehydrogenase